MSTTPVVPSQTETSAPPTIRDLITARVRGKVTPWTVTLSWLHAGRDVIKAKGVHPLVSTIRDMTMNVAMWIGENATAPQSDKRREAWEVAFICLILTDEKAARSASWAECRRRMAAGDKRMVALTNAADIVRAAPLWITWSASTSRPRLESVADAAVRLINEAVASPNEMIANAAGDISRSLAKAEVISSETAKSVLGSARERREDSKKK